MTVSLVLLVLWVPITTHCCWEGVIGGDLFKCAPLAAEKGDCSNDGDSCSSVESGSYKVSDVTPDLPAPVFSVVLFELPVLVTMPSLEAASQTAAPDEILTTWQFVSRSALPPRAPSFVS